MRRFILPLLLTALAPAPGLAQVPEAKDVESVVVELSSFQFTPSDLNFRHGRTYRLRLVNTSSGGHDFAASEFFAASSIAQQDKAKIVNGRVALHDGESVEITLVPIKPGTYPLKCSHFMHGAFGMHGTITVK